MSAEHEAPADEPTAWLLGTLGCVLALCAVSCVWLAANGMAGFSVVVGGILVVLAVWIVLPIRRGRRRIQEVRQWGHDHGWRAEPPRARTVTGGTEVLRGVVDGISVTSCTTEYDPDWRRGLDTTRYRHLLMSQIGADFPVLTMVPTGGARRAPAGPDEGTDLRFEWADFDARWRVQCADARFAHGFCHPRVMERLMRPDVAGLSFLVAGGDVAVHAAGATRLDAVEARAAVLTDLVRLLPAYLIIEHRAPVGTPVRRLPPTRVLRGATAGETTGWPTVVMSAIVLAGVAWFVVMMARAGEVTFALWTVGVVMAVGAIPILRSRAVRRRRRRQQ